ncbi:MAG: ferredoxin [Desulfobacterales bacterium]|nr:MAG: ferredoxin [Desulfobacterales bacterium]
MDQYKVTFLPYDKAVEVRDGESLIRAALQGGIHINASCGGEGLCGKCRVLVKQGNLLGGISERLGSEDVDKGYRLACLSKVKEDVTIRIPVESAIDRSVFDTRIVSRRTASIQCPDFERLKEQGLFFPPVEKRYLELQPPDTDNHIPDVTRLIEYLKREHDEHRLELAVPVIRDLPSVLREQGFKVTVTMLRSVRDDGQTRIINIQPGDTTAEHFAIAVDLGTTTVYAQLLDLVNGISLAEAGDFNGQISYGEDVISRIVYAEKGTGLQRLQQVVVETINLVIGILLRESGVDRGQVSTVVMAGNTTMTQLLLALDPRHLRRSPYVPVSTLYPPVHSTTIGIDLDDHAVTLLYPAVSSYVGGDIVAGVMGTGMYRDEELTLFLDIGTNAEIVIGNKDWLACTACSAGPAFEGGGIEFGMRAAKGAIEDVSLDPVSLEPMLLTIGDVRPKGICGSGLITIAAIMFEMGVINNRGKFNRDLGTSRIREHNGIWEYVLAWRDETQIDRDIVLTETDIDNLIRAKGAVYSGCMTLLEEVGLSMDVIERIILAGGFGSYIDLDKAMTIGLLPEIDPDRVTFIGNGSLIGARMISLTNRMRKEVLEVTGRMTNFELSETPSYMDHYIAAMFLPHTEIEKFPMVKQKRESWRQVISASRN